MLSPAQMPAWLPGQAGVDGSGSVTSGAGVVIVGSFFGRRIPVAIGDGCSAEMPRMFESRPREGTG